MLFKNNIANIIFVLLFMQCLFLLFIMRHKLFSKKSPHKFLISNKEQYINHFVNNSFNNLKNQQQARTTTFKATIRYQESFNIIKNILGELPLVDSPDLVYRNSSYIRSQLPTIFKELPSNGFDENFKNPCWYTQETATTTTNKKDEKELVCLPYAYVLGQPKCGTSDLFERIRRHHFVRFVSS
jgi:hypothetical protein